LDTAKIGLQVTDHFLLTPQKSVTAILGLTKEPQTARVDACATCRIAETCILRKAGNPCG
ncbi:MAG: methionine synthase, partial [Oscillospiraceae bacterium]|nr:methionine synthase [Oscillospiraceae bacterium]